MGEINYSANHVDETFTKAILKRPENFPKKGDRPSHFKTQGFPGENQFWEGPKCYIPILYKGQPERRHIKTMNEHEYKAWKDANKADFRIKPRGLD